MFLRHPGDVVPMSKEFEEIKRISENPPEEKPEHSTSRVLLFAAFVFVLISVVVYNINK